MEWIDFYHNMVVVYTLDTDMFKNYVKEHLANWSPLKGITSNKIWPKLEPCGTPVVKSGQQNYFPILTKFL